MKNILIETFTPADRGGSMEFKFNQILLNSLLKRFKLEDISPPQDLKCKDSFSKDSLTKIKHYKDEKIGKIELSETLPSGFVNNHHGVIYPADGYDFPIFDFMFSLIDKSLIALIELHPLRKDEGYLEKYVFPMRKLHQNALQMLDPMPYSFSWIRGFSSGYGFFSETSETHLPEIESTFKRYLELWVRYVKEAIPIVDKEIKHSALRAKERFSTLYFERFFL